MLLENRTKRGIRPAQAAEKLGVSLPTLWRYARVAPDFPQAVRLSPNVTIFDEGELDAYVARRASGEAPPLTVNPPDGKIKRAAAALGARLVDDLTPAERRAWNAAGRPCRVQLGGVELVLLKAIERSDGRKQIHNSPQPGSFAASPAVVPAELPPKRGPGRPRNPTVTPLVVELPPASKPRRKRAASASESATA